MVCDHGGYITMVAYVTTPFSIRTCSMARAVSVVLAVVFQVISSQGPPPFPPNTPPQCQGPPEGIERPYECCVIPPFFQDRDFEECGFKRIEEDPGDKHESPDCSKQLCMLNRYGLLKDDGNIDYGLLTSFMDAWTAVNTNFQPAMEKAKERCIGKPLPGPPHICEVKKIVFCVGSILFGKCPKWEESERCQKLKSHIEECAPFFAHL